MSSRGKASESQPLLSQSGSYYNSKLNESTISSKSLSSSFQQPPLNSSTTSSSRGGSAGKGTSSATQQPSSSGAPASAGGAGAGAGGVMSKLRKVFSGEGLKLTLLLFSVILIGTSNRVTFKVMQYGMTNYMYFVSQFTSLVFIPIFFGIILFKRLFTNDITEEQLKFPKYKFAVMGAFDTLQGLLITVGGNSVPGMMQNLLLQGAVPVTMLTSILFLRPTGCDGCKKARKFLKTNKIPFSEQSIRPNLNCSDEECQGWVSINGANIKNTDLNEVQRVINHEMPGVLKPKVVLNTSGQPWKTHLKTFYSVWQYIGAAIILAGLVVSVWPSVAGGGGAGGPVGADLLFFTATVPTALSAVYKEIAFKSCEDMDVWYLNGWVSLFQFILGLPLAPVAAVMSDISMSDIPSSIWNGVLCLFASQNTIVPDSTNSTCSILSTCVENSNCCDSCDGSYSGVSSVAAYGGMLMYLTANLAYNVIILLVIKYGSAALLYVASTAVLPLGAICFTIPAFLGEHAKDFTAYDGSGLGVVLCGLIVYRFLGSLMRSKGQVPSRAMVSVNMTEPALIASEPLRPKEPFRPRTASRMRSDLYLRLGLQTPPPQHMRINMAESNSFNDTDI